MRVSKTVPEEETFNRTTVPPNRRKGPGIRAWLVVTVSGSSYLEEVGKHSIMRRTGLPARDLRVLDPLLSYPSSILGRERAIVINLEHMKAIITATEVLVLNSKDPLVAPFVQDLQSRVSNSNEALGQATKISNTDAETMNEAFAHSPQSAVCCDLASPTSTSNYQQLHVSFEASAMASKMKESSHDRILDIPKAGGPKTLPFEFKVLEVCLESACRCLEFETSTLEQEAYPALDELTSKISTLNLEHVRQIKSRLVAISGRVQKVRDELEHLLDDDMDMAEMYLTDKLACQSIDESSSRDELADDALELDNESDEEAKSIIGKTKSAIEIASLSGLRPNIQELEMLLEAYFVQIDGTLNKLFTMRDYVDDTEDYINIMLDDKQNQLLQMGVMVSTATLILSLATLVMSVFGMNIRIDLFNGVGNKKFLATVFGSVGGCFLLYLKSIRWGKKLGILA